jgi:hypothetical protein
MIPTPLWAGLAMRRHPFLDYLEILPMTILPPHLYLPALLAARRSEAQMQVTNSPALPGCVGLQAHWCRHSLGFLAGVPCYQPGRPSLAQSGRGSCLPRPPTLSHCPLPHLPF